MRTLPILQSALAVSLAVGGCTATRPEPADVEPDATGQTGVPDAVPTGDVRIGLSETVAVDGVPVRFARVIEDSRCPPDVSCVWAGRAHVELVVGGEAHVLSVPGYGPDDQPSEATAGGLTVRVSAMAGPVSSERPAGEAAPVWVEIVAARSSL